MRNTLPYWLCTGRCGAGFFVPEASLKEALRSLAVLALAVFPGGGCRADGNEWLMRPLDSRNLSPLQANLGVPPMRETHVPGAGEWSVSWTSHWASHSILEPGEGRVLEFDGETRRQDLAVTVGLGSRVSARLNVPYVHHTAGRLDSVIDNWHGFWGLPDGPRAGQPRNVLRFGLASTPLPSEPPSGLSAPAPGFLLTDSGGGLGDVEIAVDAVFAQGELGQLGGFVSYKLASGDVGDFSGSGDAGAAMGLRFSRSGCGLAVLDCHLQGGLVHVGSLPYGLNGDRRVAFAGVSLAWQLGPTLALLAQLDWQGAVFSDAPLANPGAPVLGSAALRWQPGERWVLDLGFSEDLNVGAAPDVSFRLNLSRPY